jgi:hypothetical protein
VRVKWREAINNEFEDMDNKGVWDVISRVEIPE